MPKAASTPTSWTRFVFAAGVLFLLLTGCKEPPPPFVPVSGTVTINGQPLANAQVRFVPLQEGLNANFMCSAITGEDGTYTLTPPGKSGPGGCACECKVLVIEGSAPEEAYKAYMSGDPRPMDQYNKSLKNRPIPGKYGRMSSSPIVIKVTAETEKYDLELER